MAYLVRGEQARLLGVRLDGLHGVEEGLGGRARGSTRRTTSDLVVSGHRKASVASVRQTLKTRGEAGLAMGTSTRRQRNTSAHPPAVALDECVHCIFEHRPGVGDFWVARLLPRPDGGGRELGLAGEKVSGGGEANAAAALVTRRTALVAGAAGGIDSRVAAAAAAGAVATAAVAVAVVVVVAAPATIAGDGAARGQADAAHGVAALARAEKRRAEGAARQSAKRKPTRGAKREEGKRRERCTRAEEKRRGKRREREGDLGGVGGRKLCWLQGGEGGEREGREGREGGRKREEREGCPRGGSKPRRDSPPSYLVVFRGINTWL